MAIFEWIPGRHQTKRGNILLRWFCERYYWHNYNSPVERDEPMVCKLCGCTWESHGGPIL